MEYEEGEAVLCTVEKIVGTTVFVHLENNREGSIVISEIAPGRIRNLREYVTPKKKIVCRILRITPTNIELSLRRVTQKEKKEVLENANNEKSYLNILKSILKEKAEEVVEKIKEKENLSEFISKAKENPKELEKITGKENSEKIIEILKKQKDKKTQVKKEIKLYLEEPNGIELIKKVFDQIKNTEIKYLGAGKYSLICSEDNLKKADSQINETIAFIKDSLKSKKFFLDVA